MPYGVNFRRMSSKQVGLQNCVSVAAFGWKVICKFHEGEATSSSSATMRTCPCSRSCTAESDVAIRVLKQWVLDGIERAGSRKDHMDARLHLRGIPSNLRENLAMDDELELLMQIAGG